tara:strand:- start:532 stop:822 length:291 start_codon:yes stop_codon:yes gene_type:complete
LKSNQEQSKGEQSKGEQGKGEQGGIVNPNQKERLFSSLFYLFYLFPFLFISILFVFYLSVNEKAPAFRRGLSLSFLFETKQHNNTSSINTLFYHGQ